MNKIKSKLKIKKKKQSAANQLFCLTLTAFFISLTLLADYISTFIRIPFPYGFFSWPIETVVYVYAFFLLKGMYYRYFYFFAMPLLMLLIPGKYLLNPVQAIVEYILVYWCFFGLFFFKPKERLWSVFHFFVLYVFIGVVIKWALHTLAGIIWWAPVNPTIIGNLNKLENLKENLTYSVAYNASYAFIAFLTYVPLLILLYHPLTILQTKVIQPKAFQQFQRY